jgi:hypothetical protein
LTLAARIAALERKLLRACISAACDPTMAREIARQNLRELRVSAVQTFKFIAFCVDFLGSKSGEFVDVGAAGREECGDGDPAFLSDDVTMGA